MADTMITFQAAMLIGLTCLVSGMFCGAGAFAAALEIFGAEKEPRMDYDALQRELDSDFGKGTVVEAGTLRTL